MTERGEDRTAGGSAPEVEVLLATYNGERFLAEQIESILSQSYGRLRVLARDDGSDDGTPGILASYAARYPERFRVLAGGERTGSAAANFRRLMEAASAEYLCFADQDDVWLPDKVRLSMEAMRGLEGRYGEAKPKLVFTDLRVVDAELRTIARSLWEREGTDPETIHRIARLVGRNVVTGCTMLINRPMLELARQMPEAATMHDRWIGLLASTLGVAGVAREQTVLYRQHGGNVIGAAPSQGSVWGAVSRGLNDGERRRERWRSEQQAEALLRAYGGEMSRGRREILGAYLRSGRSPSRAVRIWTTLRYGLLRGGLVRNLSTLVDVARGATTRGDVGGGSGRDPGA